MYFDVSYFNFGVKFQKSFLGIFKTVKKFGWNPKHSATAWPTGVFKIKDEFFIWMIELNWPIRDQY